MAGVILREWSMADLAFFPSPRFLRSIISRGSGSVVYKQTCKFDVVVVLGGDSRPVNGKYVSTPYEEGLEKALEGGEGSNFSLPHSAYFC